MPALEGKGGDAAWPGTLLLVEPKIHGKLGELVVALC